MKVSDLLILSNKYTNFFDDLYLYITNVIQDTPMFLTTLNSSHLDVLFYSYFKNRDVTPLVLLLYEINNNTINATLIREITKIMYDKYILKWNHIYKAMELDTYDALTDIDITEKRTPDITRQTNVNSSVTETNQERLNAFQSSNSVNVQDSTKTTSGTSLLNEQKNTETGTDTTTRKGNESRTKQELLNQEIEIRRKNFFDILFQDYAYELTLEIY